MMANLPEKWNKIIFGVIKANIYPRLAAVVCIIARSAELLDIICMSLILRFCHLKLELLPWGFIPLPNKSSYSLSSCLCLSFWVHDDITSSHFTGTVINRHQLTEGVAFSVDIQKKSKKTNEAYVKKKTKKTQTYIIYIYITLRY